jgi:hypothetical protein
LKQFAQNFCCENELWHLSHPTSIITENILKKKNT